jgi:uncharacterized protein (DUF486 family)
LPLAYEMLATYFEPKIADKMADPIAFLAKTDPDTLYYHQAMKAPDAKEFQQAMQGQVGHHCNNKHWEVRKRSQVQEGVKVLDSVLAMRRKRRIETKEIYKWKARLNIHGGQQEYGINYWETFAPVVTWISIRLVLILSIVLSWHTSQIDFILAYPQAPIGAHWVTRCTNVPGFAKIQPRLTQKPFIILSVFWQAPKTKA